MSSLPYMKCEQKRVITVGRKSVELVLPLDAHIKLRVFQALLRKGRSSSCSTLAEEVFGREVVIWDWYFIDMFSWLANPIDWLGKNATRYELKLGREKIISNFWREYDFSKTSALGKRKTSSDKKQFYQILAVEKFILAFFNHLDEVEDNWNSFKQYTELTTVFVGTRFEKSTF